MEITLKEIIKSINMLNNRAMELTGQMLFSVEIITYEESSHYQIKMLGITIWDSNDDEREGIDKCHTCDGKGFIEIEESTVICEYKKNTSIDECPICDGIGKTGPLESLLSFIPREALRFAFVIIGAMKPNQQCEDELPHDSCDDLLLMLKEI